MLTQVSAVTLAIKTGVVIISTNMKMCMNEDAENKGKEQDDFYVALSIFILTIMREG